MNKKKKVWKDANDVIKAASIPYKKKKWYEMMVIIPKGEKSK